MKVAGRRPRGAVAEPHAPQETPALGETLDFMRLLWDLHHGLQSRSKRMEATIGVTGPQRLVIRIVGRFPRIGAGRLADLLRVDPSTLTGVLARLERGGLIRRRADPADGRRALFDLTPGGTDAGRGRAGTVEAAVRAALARLPGRDVAAARKVLRVLAEELERPEMPHGIARTARSGDHALRA